MNTNPTQLTETQVNTQPVVAILALGLVLVACAPRQPQNGRPEIPNAEKRLYTLKHKLQLTDEQIEAIRPIIEREHDKKVKIMESADFNDREEMQGVRKKVEDLEWEIMRDLAEHLTEDQMHAYSDLLAEEEAAMKEKMQSRGGRRGGGGRPGGRH